VIIFARWLNYKLKI